MNKDNQGFLELNNIDPESLREKVDCKLYSQEAINRIVALYGFQKDKGEKEISIADIVRLHRNERRRLL